MSVMLADSATWTANWASAAMLSVAVAVSVRLGLYVLPGAFRASVIVADSTM